MLLKGVHWTLYSKYNIATTQLIPMISHAVPVLLCFVVVRCQSIWLISFRVTSLALGIRLPKYQQNNPECYVKCIRWISNNATITIRKQSQCMTLNIFKACHLGYLNLKIYNSIKIRQARIFQWYGKIWKVSIAMWATRFWSPIAQSNFS